MAYKTTATTDFNLDLNTIIEEAFERCGAELRTGYDFRTAKRSLALLLMDWSNRGINLWTLEVRALQTRLDRSSSRSSRFGRSLTTQQRGRCTTRGCGGCLTPVQA